MSFGTLRFSITLYIIIYVRYIRVVYVLRNCEKHGTTSTWRQVEVVPLRSARNLPVTDRPLLRHCLTTGQGMSIFCGLRVFYILSKVIVIFVFYVRLIVCFLPGKLDISYHDEEKVFFDKWYMIRDYITYVFFDLKKSEIWACFCFFIMLRCSIRLFGHLLEKKMTKIFYIFKNNGDYFRKYLWKMNFMNIFLCTLKII